MNGVNDLGIPWKVARTITGSEEMLTLRGESGSGDKIYDAMIEGQDCFIAGVGGKGKAQCLARARLIAAAPDLLQACRMAYEEGEQIYRQSITQKLLRDAIAKAEGKQHENLEGKRA